ncbi:hypothetical protein WG66_005975 [Moniliophthora roreri]|nr:hypothetical protein WG66_005975 [Moniliophthora roreri]
MHAKDYTTGPGVPSIVALAVWHPRSSSCGKLRTWSTVVEILVLQECTPLTSAFNLPGLPQVFIIDLYHQLSPEFDQVSMDA